MIVETIRGVNLYTINEHGLLLRKMICPNTYIVIWQGQTWSPYCVTKIYNYMHLYLVTFRYSTILVTVIMPTLDSPSIIVARFLRANNYNDVSESM